MTIFIALYKPKRGGPYYSAVHCACCPLRLQAPAVRSQDHNRHFSPLPARRPSIAQPEPGLKITIAVFSSCRRIDRKLHRPSRRQSSSSFLVFLSLRLARAIGFLLAETPWHLVPANASAERCIEQDSLGLAGSYFPVPFPHALYWLTPTTEIPGH